MKLIKTYYFLLVIFILSACSSFEDENKDKHAVWIDSLSVEKVELRTVDFTAHIFCGSMCWDGYYFEKFEQGSDIYLKLFVTSDGSACPAVCVERSFLINTEFSYRVHTHFISGRMILPV